MQSAHDGSQCNASSTLYIVIETGDLGPVVVEDPSSIGQAEVFTGRISVDGSMVVISKAYYKCR